MLRMDREMSPLETLGLITLSTIIAVAFVFSLKFLVENDSAPVLVFGSSAVGFLLGIAATLRAQRTWGNDGWYR